MQDEQQTESVKNQTWLGKIPGAFRTKMHDQEKYEHHREKRVYSSEITKFKKLFDHKKFDRKKYFTQTERILLTYELLLRTPFDVLLKHNEPVSTQRSSTKKKYFYISITMNC